VRTVFQICFAVFVAGHLPSRAFAQSSTSWLRFGGEERVRFEDLRGIAFQPAGNAYLLQRLRLNFDIAARSWLKVTVQAQDSRVFFSNVTPAPISQRSPMDLRLGYVQLGDSEAGPVSFRAGRQSFSFGEGRLVADPNWSNVGRSFDGLRLTLRYRRVKIDAFTGISDKVTADAFDLPTPGQHFHGIYASLDRLIPQATLEPYLFWRLEHNVKGELTMAGNLDEKTAGIRSLGKLPLGFDYGWELAVQRGRQAGEPLAAWAGHWVVGHLLSGSAHRPRLFAELNRASGDQNPRDGVHGAFDPLFPSSHDKLGAADQGAWENIVHSRAGLQYTVRKPLLLTAAYNSFWLANRRDGLYVGGKMIVASNGSEGNHVGQEADLQVKWNPTRTTSVDLAAGHIFPGEFLRRAGHPSAYQCLLLAVTQRF
jgi:hypothetical protein